MRWPPRPCWRLTTRLPYRSIRSRDSIVVLLLLLPLLALALLQPSASAASHIRGCCARRPPMRRLFMMTTTRHSHTTTTTTTTAAAAAASVPTPAALRQSVLNGLRRRLKPVPNLDTDARRYARDREAFKAYLLGRFGLASLAAQGEESSVRRAVHARLLQDDPVYRGLVESELTALEDPWKAGAKQSFRPLTTRITSASQRDAYLPAARAGLAAVDKAMGQLEIGVEKARERVNADPEDVGARAALAEREARWAEMEAKKGRFEALVAVLGRVENRLGEARAEVLARLAARAAAGAASDDGGGGSGMAVAVAPPRRRDTTAWGKAVEKEAKAALEAVLAEVNGGGDGPPLQLLASVLFKTLDGEEMVALREEALAAGGEGLYVADVGRPKGEIDLLVVRPRPDDAKTLQVVLAVEVKRSLDEVAVDCLKLHLLLDMCARASGHSPPHFACGRSRQGEPSTEDGFVLDFSSLGGSPAEAAVYLAKRGGPTLRAVSKLMLEVVQLAHLRAQGGTAVEEEGGEAHEEEEEEEEEEEADRRVGRRLLDFYAPDFVDADESGGPAVLAEAARDGVVNELWQRFRTSGVDRLEARVGRVARALTGGASETGAGLRTVFVLGNSGGDV